MVKPKIDENSQAVQSHLGIMQNVIQRMASNSTSCKTWCITVVSAILVMVADKGKPKYALLTLIPIFLFLFLDAYYLALEKAFINSYNKFITKLHSSNLTSDDLYAVAASGNLWSMTLLSLASFSVWPFYLTLTVMTCLAMKLILS